MFTELSELSDKNICHTAKGLKEATSYVRDQLVCMKSVNVFILPFIVESKLLWPLGMFHLIFLVQMY